MKTKLNQTEVNKKVFALMTEGIRPYEILMALADAAHAFSMNELETICVGAAYQIQKIKKVA